MTLLLTLKFHISAQNCCKRKLEQVRSLESELGETRLGKQLLVSCEWSADGEHYDDHGDEDDFDNNDNEYDDDYGIDLWFHFQCKYS